MSRPLITLLTDFGLGDGYVAAMKGVILDLAPEASIVDISHDIAPQAVAQAAFVLDSVFDYYPAGTVHVAVVDPGVGTARRALAARVADRMVLAPDNGLLSPLLARHGAVEVRALRNAAFFLPEVSATFHGRDVFAPVAARLATGTPFHEVGPEAGGLVRLPDTPFESTGDRILGEVIYLDRFGNAVTNIPASALPLQGFDVAVRGHAAIPFHASYGLAPQGQPLALVGSHGRLEIAVNGGSAASVLGLRVGATVTVHWENG